MSLFRESKKKDSAFQLAVKNGHKDIAQFFISKGYRMRAVDRMDNLCLQFAVTSGHMDIVGLLIEAGCDMSFRDVRGRDALFHATVSRNIQIVK